MDILKQKNNSVIALIVLLVVIVAGVVGYFVWTQKLLIGDEVASWKTYSNTRYSYTVKHPSNWYVTTTSESEADFTQRGSINEFIGGDTYFANYPNLSNYNIETNPEPKDLFSISLFIYKVASDISYDQFLSNYSGYEKKENISINGKDAVRVTNVSVDHPIGVTIVGTYIKVGNKMFVFGYGGDSASKDWEQMKNISDNIINSFTTK